mgnify:CR=1 FL=1
MLKIGLVSVSAHPEEDRDRMQDFAAKPDMRPDRMCERRQLQITLARAIGTLGLSARATHRVLRIAVLRDETEVDVLGGGHRQERPAAPPAVDATRSAASAASAVLA